MPTFSNRTTPGLSPHPATHQRRDRHAAASLLCHVSRQDGTRKSRGKAGRLKHDRHSLPRRLASPYKQRQGERRNLARAMIVTCTSCSKRYLVDARALGASGRNVRCAGCGNTWFLAPPPDAAAPLEDAAPLPIDIDAERRERRVQLPAVKKSRGYGALIGWGLVVVVLVGGVWGLVVARAYVVSVWPPAARLYS